MIKASKEEFFRVILQTRVTRGAVTSVNSHGSGEVEQHVTDFNSQHGSLGRHRLLEELPGDVRIRGRHQADGLANPT